MHHFLKQYQWLNFHKLTLCVWVSRTNQTHTFSRVFRDRFQGSTLCLQPNERTQFFMGDWFTLQQVYESNLLWYVFLSLPRRVFYLSPEQRWKCHGVHLWLPLHGMWVPTFGIANICRKLSSGEIRDFEKSTPLLMQGGIPNHIVSKALSESFPHFAFAFR